MELEGFAFEDRKEILRYSICSSDGSDVEYGHVGSDDSSVFRTKQCFFEELGLELDILFCDRFSYGLSDRTHRSKDHFQTNG